MLKVWCFVPHQKHLLGVNVPTQCLEERWGHQYSFAWVLHPTKIWAAHLASSERLLKWGRNCIMPSVRLLQEITTWFYVMLEGIWPCSPALPGGRCVCISAHKTFLPLDMGKKLMTVTFLSYSSVWTLVNGTAFSNTELRVCWVCVHTWTWCTFECPHAETQRNRSALLHLQSKLSVRLSQKHPEEVCVVVLGSNTYCVN